MSARKHSTHPASATMIRMHAHHQTESLFPENLICSCTEGWYVIPVSEISHCTAEGNYVRVYFGTNQSVLASKTLRTVEQLLPKSGFVKPHQSHIVALDQIRFLGGHELVMKNGERIPVSRSSRPGVKHALLLKGVRLE